MTLPAPLGQPMRGPLPAAAAPGSLPFGSSGALDAPGWLLTPGPEL